MGMSLEGQHEEVNALQRLMGDILLYPRQHMGVPLPQPKLMTSALPRDGASLTRCDPLT